jgi:hypothetical protein
MIVTHYCCGRRLGQSQLGNSLNQKRLRVSMIERLTRSAGTVAVIFLILVTGHWQSLHIQRRQDRRLLRMLV